MMWWGFPFGMGLGIVWMVVLWGGLIALIVWGIKKLTERDSVSKRSALDIARERYARGEISKEQFEQLKRDLG